MGMGFPIVIVNCSVVLSNPVESTTFTENCEDPVTVGVPDKAPDDEIDNQAGSDEPGLTDQVYGVDPPVAISVALYATFTVAFRLGDDMMRV